MIEINPSDLKIENYGYTNSWAMTRPSGVRITHIPTSIVAKCNEHRSEFANKHQAMESLRKKVRKHVLNVGIRPVTTYNPHPDFEQFMRKFFMAVSPNMPMEHLQMRLRRGDRREYSDSIVYVAFKAFVAGRASRDSK